MPEPRAMPLASGPVPMWPDTLPVPQAEGFRVNGPMRVEAADVLTGVTRLAVKARTAPVTFNFQCFFTPLQQEIFEGWYRDVIENHDGEFYARWIGGSRVVAFTANYSFAPIGKGWTLTAAVVRTRIDHTACDEFISAHFQNIYRADLAAIDIYQADLAAVDRYVSAWSLKLLADNEC